MFWVVQENFITSEEKYKELMAALDRLEIPHQLVKTFEGEMVPDVNVPNPVFCIGGTSMSKVAAKKGFSPGYIGENLEYDKLLKNYGNLMLNSDAIVGTVRDISPPWKQFFIRPCNDRKSFSGKIADLAALEDWRKELASVGAAKNSKTEATLDSMVVCASLKEIDLEWRFFVVGGEVITGSLYKRGGELRIDALVDERAWEFARKIVKIWQPNEAFCLDVCETADHEMRVMEINSLCSAGFYACDMFKTVASIQAHWESK